VLGVQRDYFFRLGHRCLVRLELLCRLMLASGFRVLRVGSRVVERRFVAIEILPAYFWLVGESPVCVVQNFSLPFVCLWLEIRRLDGSRNEGSRLG